MESIFIAGKNLKCDGKSPVNSDHLPCNVAGIAASEEPGYARNFIGVGSPAQGQMMGIDVIVFKPLAVQLVLPVYDGHGGVYKARGYGIYEYAPAGQLQSRRPAVLIDSGFCHCITAGMLLRPGAMNGSNVNDPSSVAHKFCR